MNNELLLETLREKARCEQKLSLEVIDLIRLVDERRLFLKLGFSSLFDFVTKDLGYESSSAMRRIQAARLISEIPQVREKIENKSLSLSVVSQAQSFFRRENKISRGRVPLSRKLEVLKRLEHKSAREAEKEFATLNPIAAQPIEHVREISAELTEIRVSCDTDTYTKLEELRALLAHQNPDLSYRGLLKLIVEKTYNQVMKEKGIGHAAAQRPTSAVAVKSKSDRATQTSHLKIRKSIPTAAKRLVWQRDQSRCQYQDPVTRRKCESKYFLEIDHIHRHRHGGSDSPGNLRLLCRRHNAARG